MGILPPSPNEGAGAVMFIIPSVADRFADRYVYIPWKIVFTIMSVNRGPDAEGEVVP
jgi:hypothetical protein